MEECQLADFDYTGCRLLWNNGQEEKIRIEKKIDQALINERWRDDLLFLKAFIDTPQGSDHSPCIVTIREEERSRRYPFRFKNFWCNEDEFQGLT